jgi:hypothetical protein
MTGTINTSTNQTVYSKAVGAVTVSLILDNTIVNMTKAVAYSISNTTIGPRVIRAYQGTLPVLGSATPTPNLQSVPTTLMVTPGGLKKDLILK